MTSLLCMLGCIHAPCKEAANPEWTTPDWNFPDYPITERPLEIYTDFNIYYDINADGEMEYLVDSALGALSTRKDGSEIFYTWLVGDAGNSILGVGPDGKIYTRSSYRSTLYRFDGIKPGNIEVLIPVSNSVTGADFNFDGRTDFYYENSSNFSEKSILEIMPDGTIYKRPCTTMSPEEYAGVRSELKLTSGGEGIPGWEDMYGGDKATPSGIKEAEMADVNNDGLPDIFDITNGNYLLNTGDGRFVFSGYGAKSWLRDFDGDGINDVLQYKDGTLLLYRGSDPSTTPVSISEGLNNIPMLWCRDVDADGDVDIVFITQHNYYDNDCYLIVAENQGDLKFRKRERMVTFSSSSINSQNVQFLDIDCDGKYEFLYTAPMGETESGTVSHYVYLKIDGTWEFTSANPITLFDKPVELTKTRSSEGWSLFSKGVKALELNAGTRPEKPAAPSLFYDRSSGQLHVTWERGSDAETPAADLTYELRIGTSTRTYDIARPHALADGSRRNLRPGMCGYSTKMVFNTSSWPEGDIYISVQTIDDTFLGSPFSEPAVFHKDCPASDFNYSVGKSFAVNQTVTFTPSDTHSSGKTYNWDFGTDAVVVNEDAATHVYEVEYTSCGDKEITLTVENSNGVRSSTTKKLRVEPVYVTDWTYGSNKIDLDGDGVHEIINQSAIWAENADGKYDEIKKSWNSGIGSTFADVNGDGLTDIIGGSSRFINWGDGDMEKISDKSNIVWSELDFNNDGKLDQEYNKLNDGYYQTIVESSMVTSPPPHTVAWYSTAPRFYLDFNGDGLLDMGYIAGQQDPDNPWFPTKLPFHIFENIDGVNYRLKEVREDIVDSPDIIDDIDGDGTLDFLYCDASYNFGVSSYAEFVVIQWGDGSGITKYQCPDGTPFSDLRATCDFNNDGMKDLIVTTKREDGSDDQVMTLMPDRATCTFTKVPGIATYTNAAKKRDGSYFFGSLLSTKPNERPLPPTDLRFVQTDKAVVIEWNPGSDKETPVRALRYNISIKKRGVSGEGAYLISPLNGGNDNTLLPAPIFLNTATKLTIPITSIPAGEYEVCIQSVDHYNEASQFSETLPFDVSESAGITLPTSVMVNTPVVVSLFTNNSDVEIDFGQDAVVEDLSDRKKSVTWTSEGARDIMIGGKIVAGTFVHPAIDATFSLPERVVKGASVNIGIARTSGERWEISEDTDSFTPIDGYADIEFTDNGETSLRFAKAGKYIVRHNVKREYGETFADMVIEVYDADVAIDFVEADEKHYLLHLNPATAPEGALAAKIYRETSSFGKYLPICEIAPDANTYEDIDSDPSMKTARYKISYIMPYGETALSEAHQPLHVQANRALNGGVNLMWNSYQGCGIDTYRVMKGSSPESMETFAEINGHITSYTDTSDDASGSWYGIVAIPITDSTHTLRMSTPAKMAGFSSNTVSGSDAREVQLAASVVVTSGSGALFDGAKSKQMSARILPVTASLSRIYWEIVEGSDIMDIDDLGVVTAKGIGKATVRATAQDGSGAYGEMEIESNLVPITFIDFDTSVHPEDFTLTVGETFQYKLETVTPANATESPYWECTDPYVATVDQNGLVTALHKGNTDVKVSSPSNPDVYVLMALSVVRGNVDVEGISINPDAVDGKVGDQIRLNAIIDPANATDKSLVWSITDDYTDERPAVAEITQDGLLTLMAPGSCTVMVRSNSNPEVYQTCMVSVREIQVTGIDVSPAECAGEPGTKIQLTATVYPENAPDKSVEWITYYDNGVAKVSDSGLLTILGEGYELIGARSVANPEVVSYISVTGSWAGIGALLGERGRANVYDAHGLLLLRDATEDDIKELTPGFYIIGVTRVYLTGKR